MPYVSLSPSPDGIHVDVVYLESGNPTLVCRVFKGQVEDSLKPARDRACLIATLLNDHAETEARKAADPAPAPSSDVFATCTACGQPMTRNSGCIVRTVFVDGNELRRIPHNGTAPCHDCNAAPGEMHHAGCDDEVCPWCFGQLISCQCSVDEDDRNPAALLTERRNAHELLEFARRDQEVREMAARAAAADQIADMDPTLAHQMEAAILEFLAQRQALDVAQARVAAHAKRQPQHAAAFDSLGELADFAQARDQWQARASTLEVERHKAGDHRDRAARRLRQIMPEEVWVRFEGYAVGWSSSFTYAEPWPRIEAARRRIDTVGFFAPFKDADDYDDGLPF